MSKAMVYALSVQREGYFPPINEPMKEIERVNQYSYQYIFMDDSILRFNRDKTNLKVIEDGEVVYEYNLLTGLTVKPADHLPTTVDLSGELKKTSADKIADAILYVALAVLYAAVGYFVLSVAMLAQAAIYFLG
jgi:hypothetical protein